MKTWYSPLCASFAVFYTLYISRNRGNTQGQNVKSARLLASGRFQYKLCKWELPFYKFDIQVMLGEYFLHRGLGFVFIRTMYMKLVRLIANKRREQSEDTFHVDELIIGLKYNRRPETISGL